MRSPIRWRYASAAAVLAAVAVQLSGAGIAQASSSLPADRQVSATMVLNVQVGTTVTIRGGGSGTSNCTTDETDKTIKVTASPVTESFGFIAKSSGSCAVEPSWSKFEVTVSNSQKVVVAARTVILDGYKPFFGYEPYCSTPGGAEFNLSCSKVNEDMLELTQQSGLGVKSGGHESAQLSIFVGSLGQRIRIEGGGAGPDGSHCTTDETNTTVPAGPNPTVVSIGFEAKSSGSCAFEPSYSYFNIQLLGATESGQPATATARIRFGQPHASGEDYVISCVSSSPSVSCVKTGVQSLQLIFSGGQRIFSAHSKGR